MRALTPARDADLLDGTMRASLRGKSGSKRLLVTAVSVALVSVIIARPTPAVACKDRKYPENFPVEELKGYSTVAVVKVGKVDPPAGTAWQVPPFSATAKVVKPLKGKLRRGDAIDVVTERDVEGHAVCPIRLDEGSTYLIFLNGEGSSYVAPRFGSLYLAEKHERFKSYVEAIAKASGVPVSWEADKSAESTGRCSAAPTGPEPSGASGWLALAGAIAWLRRRGPEPRS